MFESFNFFGKKETEEEARIKELKESIKNHEEWKKRVEEASKGQAERNVDVRHMDTIQYQIDKWRRELSELTGEPIPITNEEEETEVVSEQTDINEEMNEEDSNQSIA